MLEILLEHPTKPFLLDDFPASSMIYPADDVMITRFIEQFVKFAREEVDFRLGIHLHDWLVISSTSCSFLCVSGSTMFLSAMYGNDVE